MTEPLDKQQIVLCSMPWAIASRPSIQLGALKSWLERETSTQVVTIHPYLYIARTIGLATYGVIADNGWAGEALFAGLLFPEQREQAASVFAQNLGKKRKTIPEFSVLTQQIDLTCKQWVEHVQWDRYLLLGFSLCFNQLFGSLYITRILKQNDNCPAVVFGGSSCSGTLGKSLLQNFPDIDYVVDGEGEKPLSSLVNWLTGKTDQFPERVFSRTDQLAHTPSPQIRDLAQLPPPDYTPYFQQFKTVFPEAPFTPTLPLEFSRGCWWNQCAFCNLNLQWCGYRAKKAEQVVKEVEQFTRDYQSLDFTFTDNALPPREADTFFRIMADDSGADYRFFAEIRTTTQPETIALYRCGGLDTIQVGIEALSTPLLQKMKKGTTAIDNIAIMKYALKSGIALEGNLIIDFPGTDAGEIEDTLENLRFVLPYNPLATARFFLGHGSPVFQEPGNFNISAVTQHRKYRALLPPELSASLSLLVNDYRGDRQRQQRLWRPVKKMVSDWWSFHQKRPDRTLPALGMRDGVTFLLIRQELPGGEILRHKLQGLSRKIYLYCDQPRMMKDVFREFSTLGESAILAFVHQLCQKRLMFRENDQVLALAVPLRSKRRE